jgi:biotin operon repressor
MNIGNKQYGFVKLYRSSLHNGWLNNSLLWTFWCYCLIKASYKDQQIIFNGERIALQPGQLLFGRKKAADALEMSEQSVRTCIMKLKKWGNISVHATKKYSIITIINWEAYQCRDKTSESSLTVAQPTCNQHLTTYKKGKNNINQRRKKYPSKGEKKDEQVYKSKYAGCASISEI